MLSQRTLTIAENYWADHLGCAVTDFARKSPFVIPHGDELADYHGLFALFREAAPVISVPPDELATLASFFDRELAGNATSPERFVSAARKLKGTIIGPAFIGYLDEISFRPVDSDARLLRPDDEAAVDDLIAACPSLDWEHGGSLVGEQPTAGVFIDHRLVALAGYEIWGGSIAHIAVITTPEFRGHGFGRHVVSAMARHALAAGLVPQYRTLLSNQPSMRIADSLGFESFGTSIAVRLPSDT